LFLASVPPLCDPPGPVAGNGLVGLLLSYLAEARREAGDVLVTLRGDRDPLPEAPSPYWHRRGPSPLRGAQGVRSLRGVGPLALGWRGFLLKILLYDFLLVLACQVQTVFVSEPPPTPAS
jgi:hypothetical protein